MPKRRLLPLAGGRRFEYESRGRGTRLLIVHPGGPGLTAEYLRPFLQLGDRARRVVLVHPRGVGRSFRPRSPSAYTLGAMARDLDEIRRAFRVERIDLLGFSAGGFVALEYARRYGSHLTSLLLCGTAGSADDLRAANRAMRRGLAPSVRGRLRRFERARSFDSPEYTALVEEIERPYQSRYLRKPSPDLAASRLEPHVYRAMMTRTGNEFVVDGTLATWDAGPSLGGIRAPTLVLVGADDFLAPASRRLAQRIPRARLVVLERASHLAHLERPREYLATLRAFLGSVVPGPDPAATGGRRPRARAGGGPRRP